MFNQNTQCILIKNILNQGGKKSMGWLYTEEGKLRTIRLMLSNLLFPS